MEALAALNVWGYETTIPGVYSRDYSGRRQIEAGPTGRRDGDLWVFRIEPKPARDWIIASIDPYHMGYLPGLLDDIHRDRLMQALFDGEVTVADLEEINHDAIEVVSGWRWWEAGKLIACVTAQFHTMGGLLTLARVDPATTPLGAYLAAVYARIWVDSDAKTRAKLAQNVAMPPPSLLSAEKFDEEAAEAAVRAFIEAGPTGRRE